MIRTFASFDELWKELKKQYDDTKRPCYIKLFVDKSGSIYKEGEGYGSEDEILLDFQIKELEKPIETPQSWECPICRCSHRFYTNAKYCCQEKKNG